MPDAARPTVVAVIGSPHARGATTMTVEMVTGELERHGIRCETLPLAEYIIQPCRDEEAGAPAGCQTDDAEFVFDKVYAADGLILASPVYFANVSAQMKAFMDRTNVHYLHGPPLAPLAVGLVAIGGQGGLKATIAAMQRFLTISCPTPPVVESVTGIAENTGAVRDPDRLRRQSLEMADRMAAALLRVKAAK
jgi:multimeric flavodoxin WrbA